MPNIQRRAPTRVIRDEPNESGEASLHGHKAKTPIIAGSICGGVMGLAWIIGFTIYFMKRNRRKKRKAARAAGLTPPTEPKPSEKVFKDGIVIPPDPAVLLGQRQPGERAYVDGKLVESARHSGDHHSPIRDGTSNGAPPSQSNGTSPLLPRSNDPSPLPSKFELNTLLNRPPSVPPQTPTSARISEEMIVPPHV